MVSLEHGAHAVTTSRRDLVVRATQLVALSSFAIAQPLYDLLGRNPGFFSRNGAGPLELVGFALLVLVVPPAFMLAGETFVLLVGGRDSMRRAHVLLVGTLTALVFLPLFDRLSSRTDIVAVLGVVCGVSAAVLFAALTNVRRFVSWAALAPLGFLVVFLFGSPAAGVVRVGRIGPVHPVSFKHTPPIVVLRLDEFPLSSLIRPDGTIDDARYPNFAALAKRSTWYRNATTVSDVTRYAAPAIYTGSLPAAQTDLLAVDHPRSLFTALGDVYDFRGGTEGICPPSICAAAQTTYGGSMKMLGRMTYEASIAYGHVVAPESIAQELPRPESLGQGAYALPATPVGRATGPDERWLEALARVAGIERGERPSVDVIQVYIPHRPWNLLPNGASHSVFDWNVPGLRRGAPWTRDTQAVLTAYQAHLMQIGAADALVGKVTRRLHASHMDDDALVVVVADHGISFLPGQPYREDLSVASLPQIASVPFFIKYPKQRDGRVDDRPVEVTDLLPTVLDVMGSKLSWRFEGHSLLRDFSRSERTIVSSNGKHMTIPHNLAAGVRLAAEWKYVFTGLDVHPADELHTFWTSGAHRAWIGREIDSFERGPESTLRFRVEDADTYRHVGLRDSAVPAAVTAFAVGPPSPSREIVVSVNGRVGTVVRTVRWEGRTRVDGLFWPGFLSDGRNSVDLFELDGETLRPIRSSS